MGKCDIILVLATILFLVFSLGSTEPVPCNGCPPLVTHQIIGTCIPTVTSCNENNVITVRCVGKDNCPVHWQSPKGISTIIGPSAEIVCNPASGEYYCGNPNNQVSSIMCR